MLSNFIYHNTHVINPYISNETLSTSGFQKWHTINLYTSEKLIYTHKRSNNTPEGTYELQGPKCDTLSIHIFAPDIYIYIYIRKGTLQMFIYKQVINVQVIYHFAYTRRDKSCIYIHIFIYLFIQGFEIMQASLTVSAPPALLFAVSIFIWSLYDCIVLHNWEVCQSDTGGAVWHSNFYSTCK